MEQVDIQMNSEINRSYLCGNSELPLLYTTIPALLDHRATQLRNKAAHIFRNVTNYDIEKESIDDDIKLDRIVVTYQDMADKSLRVAGALLNIGLKPGDRVAVLGGNCPEWLYLDYACLRINVLMIRVPGSLMHHDAIVKVLHMYRCKMFFLDRGEMADKIHNIIPGLLTGELCDDDAAKLENIRIMFLRASDEYTRWTTVEFLSAYDGDLSPVISVQETLDPDDIAVVLPTSGSTGFPKFATYSHAKILNAANVAMTGFDPHNRGYAVVCTDRPMAWVGGLHFASVSAGYIFVQVDQRISFMERSTDLTFQIMHEEKTTGVAIMAYMLYDAMKALQEDRLVIPVSLENIITGGERLSQDLINFTNDAFKSVFIYYGLTEGYHCYKNKPTDEEGICITEIMPHTEIKVVNDTGKVVARGIPGNLHVRSAITMVGFLDDPDSTSRVLTPSGWLNTEDIAIIDEFGYIDIVGRTKDIISLGGRKIYPKTIERVLVNCPKVENVIVIGVPDVRYFQCICACVLPKKGESITAEELQAFCSANMLGNVAEIPRYFWFIDDIPKGCTGKFDRLKLVEMAIKHFNLD